MFEGRDQDSQRRQRIRLAQRRVVEAEADRDLALGAQPAAGCHQVLPKVVARDPRDRPVGSSDRVNQPRGSRAETG